MDCSLGRERVPGQLLQNTAGQCTTRQVVPHRHEQPWAPTGRQRSGRQWAGGEPARSQVLALFGDEMPSLSTQLLSHFSLGATCSKLVMNKSRHKGWGALIGELMSETVACLDGRSRHWRRHKGPGRMISALANSSTNSALCVGLWALLPHAKGIRPNTHQVQSKN